MIYNILKNIIVNIYYDWTNYGVIGSVLGLVLTGCLFAVEGFVSTVTGYDPNVWFNF